MHTDKCTKESGTRFTMQLRIFARNRVRPFVDSSVCPNLLKVKSHPTTSNIIPCLPLLTPKFQWRSAESPATSSHLQVYFEYSISGSGGLKGLRGSLIFLFKAILVLDAERVKKATYRGLKSLIYDLRGYSKLKRMSHNRGTFNQCFLKKQTRSRSRVCSTNLSLPVFHGSVWLVFKCDYASL